MLPALARFVGELRSYAGSVLPSLLPSPADGSACKRLNLFLRWMVRKDAVDPGPWTSVPGAKLVVPLDTHMFRIARGLGLTPRRQADLKIALEITAGFRAIRPDDPVRYDFSLTRLALNPACREQGIGPVSLPRPRAEVVPQDLPVVEGERQAVDPVHRDHPAAAASSPAFGGPSARATNTVVTVWKRGSREGPSRYGTAAGHAARDRSPRGLPG